MTSSALSKVLETKIKENFEVLEIINLFGYTSKKDFVDLENKINKYKDFVFSDKQIILFLSEDTFFYPDLDNGCSTNLHNLYIILKKYNIPSDFVFVFTNHYGLKKEINLLNEKMFYEIPIKNIIETPLWFDFPTAKNIESFENQKTSFNNNFLYTCLNNAQRSHRSYFLCQLKEKKLLDNGIVSYRFNK